LNSNRLEAFSDGVLAIVITVMVLEMKVPDGARIESLASTLPVFLSYVLSYLYVGIYWNNHHHMLHTVERVNGPILWANLHLLFWLSLFPFATAWMGQNHFAVLPTSLYGGVLLMAAIAYWVLQAAIIRAQGSDSLLKKAIGRDWKGRSSPAVYVTGIIVANWSPVVAQALYVAVAFLWLVPDRRIERIVGN